MAPMTMTIPGGPQPPRSSLDRSDAAPHTGSLDLLRQRAWLPQGVAALAITDITDPWLRQAIINEATRRWGPRQKGSPP